MLLVHQNTGKENRYGKNFFAVLISTLGRIDRANKKNLSYTLSTLQKVASYHAYYNSIIKNGGHQVCF